MNGDTKQAGTSRDARPAKRQRVAGGSGTQPANGESSTTLAATSAAAAASGPGAASGKSAIKLEPQQEEAPMSPKRKKKALPAAMAPMSPTLSDDREMLSNPANALYRVNCEEFNRRYVAGSLLLASRLSVLTQHECWCFCFHSCHHYHYIMVTQSELSPLLSCIVS